jgi:transposase-like protein
MEERRRYSKAFKIEAVRLLDLDETPAALVARVLGIRRNLLCKWRNQLAGKGGRTFDKSGRSAKGHATETVSPRYRGETAGSYITRFMPA